MSIGFVYFDLGNILFRFDTPRSYRQLASRCGATFDDVLRVMDVEGLADAYERGEMNDREFVDWLGRSLQIDLGDDLDGIMDAAGDMFTPIDGMPALLDRVSAKVPVGLLSNTCHAHYRWIMRRGDDWMKGFDPVVLSYQAAAMKPDRRIYRSAERALKLIHPTPPSNILFVDDKPDNVAAARRCGWQAEVCQGFDEVDAAMKRHGL